MYKVFLRYSSLVVYSRTYSGLGSGGPIKWACGLSMGLAGACLEVKSEYFRGISNSFYSYDNVCVLEQVPVMKGEEGCQGSGRSGVWKERGARGKVSGRWFSLDVKG